MTGTLKKIFHNFFEKNSNKINFYSIKYREQFFVSAVTMARVGEIKEWTTDSQVANHCCHI